MNHIELTGLLGSHPLGALAAFGLLRITADREPGARLSFIERDDWIAILHTTTASPEELLARLTEWSATKELHPALDAFGERDVRLDPNEYHGMILRAVERSGDRTLAGFLVALAADGARDNAKGLVKPSPFYMASGQQSFIDTMTKICSAARTREVWSETLFGPWMYATAESSCGWDPGTERLHALRARAPTRDKTTCVAGAVRLAFEALPLFPSFSRGGSAHAVGWAEKRRKEGGRSTVHDCFRWPIPELAVTVDGLKVLLASREVQNGAHVARARGIVAVYESVRHEFGQGYAVFRPATRVPWAQPITRQR